MSKDMPLPDLIVNKKTDHFFISINKQGPHSFVMLGVYDQNKVRHLLCRVGKFGNTGAVGSDLHLMGHLPHDLTKYKGSYIYCNDVAERKLYRIKNGCNLHLRSELPANLKKYKESYIYCDNNGCKNLYYIKSDGTSEEVIINDFKKIDENLRKIKRQKANLWHLTTEQVSSCITANGGHSLGISEEVKIADFDKLDKNINEINPQKAPRLHLSGSQFYEMISLNGGYDQDIESDYFMQTEFLCNALFFANKGKLMDEGISRNERQWSKISYQAYDITYDQYVEFLRVLEATQSLYNQFECYKPYKTDDEEVTLRFGGKNILPPLDVNSIDVNKIKASVSELHVGNTCRHSAIALIEATQHAPVSSLVSSTFFMELPYETQLEFGKPSESIPFYVLPPPPAAFFESDKTKKNIITKLYQRMENMLLLEPNSSYTQKKFLKLKELYLDIIGPSKNFSLDELLTSIQNWKTESKTTLETLRKTYFWDTFSFIKRQSSTMKLISEVEEELQRKVELDS
ncbi:hypothetical protein DGG96_14265 [Legionella qingyii]|uniref:Uncharacterized protein n=1 Tax=Legionella qingyii TaxID=2184757 RepID=A0A317TZ39_9GAMM|nr:hypothetical protein [Legionella qingyii]PWY54964.1 hypothetical protein DGG96_14265 [Legionella qingyii]RUR21002.1 hypothetical protein ELY20_13725 [Legionella qingyii]RUR27907.1 hypothetical protein ELY16_03790 [Legionella qingyii]